MSKQKSATPAGAAGAGNPSEPAGFVNERVLLAEIPVCRRTLKNWRDSGKIPYLKVGARVIYHRPSVHSALLRMQRGGES